MVYSHDQPYLWFICSVNVQHEYDHNNVCVIYITMFLELDLYNSFPLVSVYIAMEVVTSP